MCVAYAFAGVGILGGPSFFSPRVDVGEQRTKAIRKKKGYQAVGPAAKKAIRKKGLPSGRPSSKACGWVGRGIGLGNWWWRVGWGSCLLGSGMVGGGVNCGSNLMGSCLPSSFFQCANGVSFEGIRRFAAPRSSSAAASC